MNSFGDKAFCSYNYNDDKTMYFKGDAPEVGKGLFGSISKSDVYTPAENQTWTNNVKKNFEEHVNWGVWDPATGKIIKEASDGADKEEPGEDTENKPNGGTNKPNGGTENKPNGGTQKPPSGSGNSKNPNTGGTNKPVPAENGERIKDLGNVTYTVTSADAKNPTAAYTKPKNKKVTSVTIPSEVTIGEIRYQVTSISANAFKDYKKLKSATIGKNMQRIGKKAFLGCKNLNKINIRATKLKSKTIGAKALKGIYAKAEIKTPKKKKEAYKKIIQSKGAGKKVKFKN